LVLMAALAIAGAAVAKDPRPTEVPYDTPGSLPQLGPDYRQKSHKVVVITDDDLSPQEVLLQEGEAIAWISYSKVPSTIVFEREVARSMICTSLVNFSIKEDELRSAEIHAGEFASFCRLKPGHYRYRVIRTDIKVAGAGGARRRMEGAILVKSDQEKAD
jgi:hypothetical protein